MEDKEERFPGFPDKPEENYWQYPRICNGWWHILSGAEQKVLDYLLRHTWGYQKYEGDYISISQFTGGIKNRKTGKMVDLGTGLSKREVIDSLKKLEEIGFVSKRGSQKSGKTNYYGLKLLPVQKSNTPCAEKEQVGCAENAHTINKVTINNRQYPRLASEKPTGDQSSLKRQISKFPPEDYRQIESAYERLRGIKLQGDEWHPVQQDIKTMFRSGRQVADIVGCMEWLAKKSEDWMENWTIRTVRIRLPFYIANKNKINKPKFKVYE